MVTMPQGYPEDEMGYYSQGHTGTALFMLASILTVSS